MADKFDAVSREALALSQTVRPLLAGRDPGVSGAALADLVSLYVAGHHPSLREQAERNWIEAMHALILPSIQELGDLRLLPDEWAVDAPHLQPPQPDARESGGSYARDMMQRMQRLFAQGKFDKLVIERATALGWKKP